jgi:SAM-dependent methyltransferase
MAIRGGPGASNSFPNPAAIVGGMTHVFDLEGHGPAAYERYLVPTLFAECGRRLVDLAPPRPGDRVLDVACGTGIVARIAGGRAALGRLVGIDVNDAMLGVARTAGGPEAEWYDADVLGLPFPDASFDLVYCQQGVQYLAEPSAGLREMARVLVPGGRLALAVWAGIEQNPGFAVLVQALQRHAGQEAADVMRSPFAGPDGEAMRRLAAQAGLDVADGGLATFTARFPSTDAFLHRQLLASPRDGLARLTTEAPPDRAPRWDLVAGELARTLAPFTGDDGPALPMATWLVVVTRPAAAS